MLNTTETNEFLVNSRMLENVQILVVDNDCDNRDLYTALLENQGAKVMAVESIEGALEVLDERIPHLLLCELNFLGESVFPLIQRVKSLASSSGRLIPILVISTCNPISLTQQMTANIEAYLLKPVDIDGLVNQVWQLVALSYIVYPFSIRTWMFNRSLVK